MCFSIYAKYPLGCQWQQDPERWFYVREYVFLHHLPKLSPGLRAAASQLLGGGQGQSWVLWLPKEILLLRPVKLIKPCASVSQDIQISLKWTRAAILQNWQLIIVTNLKQRLKSKQATIYAKDRSYNCTMGNNLLGEQPDSNESWQEGKESLKAAPLT